MHSSPIKRLDKYFIKKYLGTFFFSLIMIMAIVVVFDFNEKVDKFVEHDAPAKAIIIDYYLNFIPYFGVKFGPLFAFISVIFFTSNMAAGSEIIAILSSGVSFNRMLRPYFFSSVLIALIIFLLNSFWIPVANKTRLDFENKYVKKVTTNYVRNVQMEVEPGVVMYIERYNARTNTGNNFFLESYKDQRLLSRITASRIKLDSTYHWTVRNYTLRSFDGLYENVKTGAKLDTVINVKPSEFFIVKGYSEQLTTPELKRYLERQKLRGVSQIKEYEVEYSRRFSFPFSCIILTVIGVSLSSKKIKGGIGLNLGLGLLISFSYILFDTMSATFVTNGVASPMIAVWIPNILYSFIAFGLYLKALK